MDLDKLAQQFGGKQITDLDALAKQLGGSFIAPTLDVEKLKAETKKYEESVPFTQRITDPLKQGIANLSGILPGLEVSSIQKEINAIREGKRGTYDPTTGERLLFQPEDQENAIKVLQDQQKEAQAKVMAAQAEAGKFQTRPAVAALSNVDSAREAFKAFQVDPLGVMSSVSLQSIPTIVPALILGAVTRNPTVGALALGSSSFAGELSSGVSEYFQEQGINIKDPIAVNKALNDQAMFAKAYEFALTRASIIGVADTAAAGLASKLLVPKNLIKNQFVKEAVNIGVAQPVAQILSGAGGEAAAQLATEGEITKPGQVLLEAAGEGPSSVLETAAFGGKRALDRLKGTPEVTPEATPKAAPATVGPVPSAIITEEDIDTDEGLTPVSPIPPAPTPAAPAAVAPTAPAAPAEPVEKGPLKGLTPAEAAIQRLKPEFQKEYFTLKDEANQILVKQKELIDQGEGEDSSLAIRLEEIQNRFDEFYKDKQYRKAAIEKLPNDPIIEEQALALADELEKIGDTASSNGLRINVSNMGGYTDPKKLDYYKGKLLEAQQKAGVAEEMPKETFSLENYIRSENKTEVKRFNEFLPKAPTKVQDLVAKSNNYLQAITNQVNSKGYKLSDISGSVDFGEMRDLRNLLSGIAGSSFLYVKNAEHIAKQNRFANPEKLAKIEQELINDFAKADQMLGAAPAATSTEEPKELVGAEKKLDDLIKNKDSIVKQMAENYKISPEYAAKAYDAELEYTRAASRAYGDHPNPISEKDFKTAIKKHDNFFNKLKGVSSRAKEKPAPTEAKTQAEINRERQAEKKAAAEAAKKASDKKKTDEAEMDAQMEAAERGEEAAKLEKKFVTDDEGEKLDFPLLVDMADKGYKVLSFNNPRAYADKIGNTFRTIEKDGVRLALEHRKLLFKQQGKEYGRVQYGIGRDKDVTFEHLQVDPSKRKKGLAKQAIQDLIDVADKNNYTLYLEPAQLEDQGMTKEQLSALYSKYGFVATNESGTPMEREPGAKAVPVEIKKTQAEINRERQIEKKTAKEVKPAEVKKPSTAIVPKVDESWADYKKEPLTKKPDDMPQEVFDQYQSFQKGNFGFTKVTFIGANALAKSNAANKEGRKVYEKAAYEFLGKKINTKFPAKNQPKLEVESLHVTPPPIAKNIKQIKTLEDQKKAILTIAAQKEERRAMLQGVLVEPNKLVVTDGNRLAIYETDTGVSERTLLDKDGKVIDMQYVPYERIVEKARNPKMYGMVNATALGNYARGTRNAYKYVSTDKNSPFSIQFKKSEELIPFNGRFIEDMANMFRQFGYEGFNIGHNDGGLLIAKSPDNKLTQYVMKMNNLNFVFQPFNVQENRPGVFNQNDVIDIQATEITEEQIMLLSDETGKLSKKELDTLEQYYGFDRDSNDFFKMLREDVIRYVNKGAEAVDSTIRSIIAKLQAGVLAVAIVFNPTFMSEPSAVAFPAKPGVEQVMAAVPDSAKDMSESAKKAYATLYPALQESLESKDKLFTIVDKPTSKMFVFNPDGSLLVKDNVLLGRAFGDTYIGQTDFEANRVTPAGLIKVKAEKGSATYDGKTVYTFGNVKEGWNAVFMHTVYLKEADAEARKKALATGKDTRLSYGCINATPEMMTKIAENNRMNESHVFVVPDNQTLVDDYIANTVPNEDLTRETVAPVTRTTQVPEKPSAPKAAAREEKAIETKTQAQINRDRQLDRLAEREKPLDKPYYNDFTSNIDYNELYKRAEVSREDRIKEYAQTRAASRRALKKIAKYGSDIPMQRELNALLDKEEMLKVAVSINKPKRNTAADFIARATQEMANENLAPEVEAVIRQVYQKYPSILEGLRLSLRTRKAGGNEAGNFNPYNRIVTLWKDSSGVEDVSVIRHELTHSLEQMMTPAAREALVQAWARSFETAIKQNPDKKSQDFFNKVFDFLDSPSKKTFDDATKIMPSYDLYQYMNPSEYWAVNAEKLMAAKLGTPWARFVSAVKKLLEGLKSVFGVNNTYAVHKEFDNLINGKLERTKNEDMLIDYLLKGNVKLDFLNSIEDVNDLLDKHSRPDASRKPSLSVRDVFMGGYDNTKETVKDVLTSPLIASNNMIGKADRALTYFRNKNIFFGYGLEEADRQRYSGQVRNAHQQAIASVAVVNALHSGNIATQVMTLGKLVFDNTIQMFVAVKSDKSMANVVREKAALIDRLGFDTGNRVIQSYFEAKRSRSIINEYLNREAAYEAAIEAGQNEEEARLDLANIEKALEKVNMNDEAIDDFIALEKQYPELRNMMDNWTSVNQNMIDMMEFSGMISKQRAKSLRNIKDYVPWYRIMDDQEDIHSAPKNTRGLTNVAADKKFGPGKTDRDIDDIVDNMIHNVLTITRNSARNYAANRIVMEYGDRYTEGKKAGKLRVFPKEGSDADGVRFNIIANGRRIVVRISDPLVAEAVIGMENIDIPMNGALAFMANTLRRSITTFPAFQVAQLFMDAPTAALVTGLKNPAAVWSGVFTSFLKNLRKDDPIVAKLRAAGIGGYQSSARTPEKEIQLDIGLIQGSWFSKAMKGLDRIGDASDYAQRRSVYLQTMKETGDEMLALFQANNVIDFKKRGSGQLAQLVTRQVAFMNAYTQSIDVLAKGLAGTGLKGIDRKKALARMATAGMMLSSATLIYCFLVGDDDEYNKLDDQTKMRTIFIPGLDIRLPMHSGAAFFFKAIPELLYNAITKEGTKDEYDRKRLTRALSKAAADALIGPNPTPTGVKPVVEILLNRNFFTGGQVTPRGMEDLAAYRQYNQNTSELGKIISALTGTEKTRLLNPIEADHLVRGLTGTIGAAAMWGTNLLSGDRPTAQAKDNPFYGQFIMPDVPRGREDLYYDLKEKTDEAYKTYMDLQKKQRKEEAAEWFKENKKLIQVYGYTSSIEADLKRLNGEIRRLADLPGEKMSPDAKRKRMTELQEIKGRMLKDVISMRKRAGFDD